MKIDLQIAPCEEDKYLGEESNFSLNVNPQNSLSGKQTQNGLHVEINRCGSLFNPKSEKGPQS